MGVPNNIANGEYRIFDRKYWNPPGVYDARWPSEETVQKPAPTRPPGARASWNYKPPPPSWGTSLFETVVGGTNWLNGADPNVSNRTAFVPGSHILQNNTVLGPQATSSFFTGSWTPCFIGGATLATLGWLGYKAHQYCRQPPRPNGDPNENGIELQPLNAARLQSQATGAAEPCLPPRPALAGTSPSRSTTFVPASRRQSIP
jgi:hypothetical protein